MRKPIRHLLSVLIIGLVATQFINCSHKEGDSGLYGSVCEGGNCNQSLEAGTSKAYLAPSAPTIMECNHDHIQLSGDCETDGARDNYIEYFLKRGEERIVFTGNVTVMQSAKCENGHYYMIVPRPPASVVAESLRSQYCGGGNLCLGEFQVHANLYTIKKGSSQFNLAASSMVLPISIQYVLQGTNGAIKCP